ncbi:hypothetical protein ISF_04147 [Cordyceps fumosorosea ARSEF 2679]|uniref:Uncharacterized protein n=1 Tax=Cordyceps fumosorosea (strain ARSEF 2679) TaxID=1081104 RepID=A0A167YGW5_CORFA|nr:hypothetical protein ISF_04147 [Cordyceps fumosorosea ARSEF 2679]OAA66309.1 hypothetical protein ISF_04147 [Cordyceps fumosorosea ARSEF 2679]
MDRLRAIAAYLWNFRYLPLKYRWPLIKLRRRLLPTQSPLGLRRSVRYARSLRHPPPPRGALLFAVCARDGELIASETQYFWRQAAWALADIPDPEARRGGEEQYAVLAATVETLVECFNWRLNLGLRRDDPPFTNVYKEPPPASPETCPSWTATAGALPEKLLLGRSTTYMDSPFHRRNIYIATGDFYSV